MKTSLFLALAFAAFGSVSSFAGPVKDWKDLDRVHKQITQALQEMQRARAANHYDMEGHGAKAEEALRQAEHELHDAVEAARTGK